MFEYTGVLPFLRRLCDIRLMLASDESGGAYLSEELTKMGHLLAQRGHAADLARSPHYLLLKVIGLKAFGTACIEHYTVYCIDVLRPGQSRLACRRCAVAVVLVIVVGQCLNFAACLPAQSA